MDLAKKRRATEANKTLKVRSTRTNTEEKFYKTWHSQSEYFTVVCNMQREKRNCHRHKISSCLNFVKNQYEKNGKVDRKVNWSYVVKITQNATINGITTYRSQ